MLVAEIESVFATAGGPPKVLRMDNGPELVSQALQRFWGDWVGLLYIPPGHPVEQRVHRIVHNRLCKVSNAAVGPRRSGGCVIRMTFGGRLEDPSPYRARRRPLTLIR